MCSEPDEYRCCEYDGERLLEWWYIGQNCEGTMEMVVVQTQEVRGQTHGQEDGSHPEKQRECKH